MKGNMKAMKTVKAMKGNTRLVFVAVTSLALLLSPAVVEAQKLVIVVRHAERADGGAGTAPMTGAPADPLLSAAGEARAGRLASMLEASGITAIFATEFRRTQDTAKPLAGKLGLTTQIVNAADTASLLQRLKTAHASDVVLIVGHSNTMPAIIKGLTGDTVTIPDAQYGDLFVLVPATGAMARLKY
jgi:broad specificity phosphatase PhoE